MEGRFPLYPKSPGGEKLKSSDGSLWNDRGMPGAEITLQVQRDEESGWLVATWDDPTGMGGISTQGRDLRNLQDQITEAVAAHFVRAETPAQIRIHFVSNAILIPA